MHDCKHDVKSLNTSSFFLSMMTSSDTDMLREQIENLDEKIIDLIATRLELADELAKAKKSSAQGYWDEDKEREVVHRYQKLCEEVGLTSVEACQIAEAILKISKDRQRHYFE